MITFNSVIEKFEDKGISWWTTGLTISQSAVPLFDPSSIMLENKNREDLYKEHREMYKELYKYQQEQLEYWNTWIDYQKHK